MSRRHRTRATAGGPGGKAARVGAMGDGRREGAPAERAVPIDARRAPGGVSSRFSAPGGRSKLPNLSMCRRARTFESMLALDR